LFKFLNTNNHLLLIVSIAILVFALSVVYNFGRFGNMGTFKYDTGNMTQLVYNSVNGRLLQFTDYNGESVFRFSEHVDPTILLALPLYILWPSPKSLMLFQSLALILAIIPLYKISFIKLKNKWLSTLVVFTFLFNPAVGNLLVSDFHAVTLSVLFILLAYYFILKKHNLYYMLFFILAILSKENVALSFIPFSLIIFFVYKNKKMGIATFLISIIWSYISFAILIPFFRVDQDSLHASFDLAYGYLGSSYIQVAQNLILNPQNTFSILTQTERLKYFTHTLSLYGFLPLLSFPYIILILPELFLKGLSNIYSMHTLNYQYTAIVTPLLLITTINFIKKLSKYFKLQFILLICIALFNLYYSFFLNNITLQFLKNSLITKHSNYTTNNNVNPVSTRFTSTPYTIVKMIPDKQSVSAPNFMGAHLSQRQNIAMYPAKYNEFENIVVEYYQTSLPPIVFSLYKTNIFLDNPSNVKYLLESSNYKLVLNENGLAYFKKVLSGGGYTVPLVQDFPKEQFKLNENTKITKPEIRKIADKFYLVTKLYYQEKSENIIIYTLNTSTTQFQTTDLVHYANLGLYNEYLSAVPIYLNPNDLKQDIKITVSEHNVDSRLTVKSSQSFIKFDNIRLSY